MKVDAKALKGHSFADLKAMRDFALNMQSKLQMTEPNLRTSFDLRALIYWEEVLSILNFEMSERTKIVFES